MSKHTKGPWESFNHYVWTTDKQNIANCKNVQDGNPMTPQESYANARLIAAAPELLEACRSTTSIVGISDIAIARAKCEAAIAKATEK